MEKCVKVNESLTLPSGCHLVKLNISKRLLNRLIKESNVSDYYANNKLDEESNEFEDLNITNDLPSNEDLVMDVLPESTRFNTTVSLNSFPNDLIDEFDLENSADSDFFDTESDELCQVTAYVQKNSRLKLILLSLDTNKDQYDLDNLIRIVNIENFN